MKFKKNADGTEEVEGTPEEILEYERLKREGKLPATTKPTNKKILHG